MRSTVSRSIAAALAGALVLTSLPVGAAQSTAASRPTVTHASPAHDATVTDFSARRRHARSHNNGAAALAAFGLIAGTIATIAANERRHDYYERRGYGYYGYAPPPRPPGYYYGPRYRYW